MDEQSREVSVVLRPQVFAKVEALREYMARIGGCPPELASLDRICEWLIVQALDENARRDLYREAAELARPALGTN